MIDLDGSLGEGGGQILRIALALGAVTQTPFHLTRIRAGRRRPGLLRQHLTGVNAVAEVCGAQIEGATLGSTELSFVPGPIRGGDYTFAVGTAGSAGLVLQALLPVLLSADTPSSVSISGGTHNPASPPAQFLEQSLLPLIRRMGQGVLLSLEAWGFYPAGGGRYQIEVEPGPWQPLSLERRGEITRIEVLAASSGLPDRIGRRQVSTALEVLGLEGHHGRVQRVPSPGPGNVVMARFEAEHVTAVFSGFGQRGVNGRTIARDMAAEAVSWRDAEVPVGPHLADQLLVPLTLGGGRFVTQAPTLHTRTAIEVIARFVDRVPELNERPNGTTIVSSPTP